LARALDAAHRLQRGRCRAVPFGRSRRCLLPRARAPFAQKEAARYELPAATARGARSLVAPAAAGWLPALDLRGRDRRPVQRTARSARYGRALALASGLRD